MAAENEIKDPDTHTTPLHWTEYEIRVTMICKEHRIRTSDGTTTGRYSVLHMPTIVTLFFFNSSTKHTTYRTFTLPMIESRHRDAERIQDIPERVVEKIIKNLDTINAYILNKIAAEKATQVPAQVASHERHPTQNNIPPGHETEKWPSPVYSPDGGLKPPSPWTPVEMETTSRPRSRIGSAAGPSTSTDLSSNPPRPNPMAISSLTKTSARGSAAAGQVAPQVLVADRPPRDIAPAPARVRTYTTRGSSPSSENTDAERQNLPRNR